MIHSAENAARALIQGAVAQALDHDEPAAHVAVAVARCFVDSLMYMHHVPAVGLAAAVPVLLADTIGPRVPSEISTLFGPADAKAGESPRYSAEDVFVRTAFCEAFNTLVDQNDSVLLPIELSLVLRASLIDVLEQMPPATAWSLVDGLQRDLAGPVLAHDWDSRRAAA